MSGTNRRVDVLDRGVRQASGNWPQVITLIVHGCGYLVDRAALGNRQQIVTRPMGDGRRSALKPSS